MSNHARGDFTVQMQPLSSAPAEGLMRFSMNKEIHGDLEATSQGEMISAGDPKNGEAGYVAIERVTGTLAGKSGGFVLQQTATMHAGGYDLRVIITPGSGAGALAGITGTFVITIANGRHSYDLEYTLPVSE
ncbi:MAG: DUF3224 domain-containing protein [Acidobacteriaceae bacterium]